VTTRFVPPRRAIYDHRGQEYFGDTSYATYNYLRGGVSDRVKRRHFEAALAHVERAPRPPRSSTVIDMGCADGVFLPSLDARFDRVIGLDIRPEFVAAASDVISGMELAHTTVHCTADLEWAEVRQLVGEPRADLVFLLETLEHIGDRDRFYESKIDFLRQVTSLMRPGAELVMSVPNMVGASLLAQQMVLRVTRRYVERISAAELARGVFRRDVSSLEPRWDNDDHLGFNHLRLEDHLPEIGEIVVRKNLGFSVFYVLRIP
jgi:2-polyprenyl-3-methyl-5-hydroxy-6-metoxy-1,4-benzoquinol methylase